MKPLNFSDYRELSYAVSRIQNLEHEQPEVALKELLGFDPEESVSLLEERRNTLHKLWSGARNRGNFEEADRIKAATMPLFAALRARHRRASFFGVCPVSWIANASDDEALAAVHSPVLKKLLTEPLVTNRSMLLCAPTKAGKSTSVALMVKRAIWSGFISEREASHLAGPHIVWAYARSIPAAARMHPLGEGEAQEITRAKKAALLVLDDLGLEKDAGELVDVMHERYESGRVTWTTTGLTKEQLNERYGEAFVRRLVEGRSQPGLVVNCFGKAGAR